MSGFSKIIFGDGLTVTDLGTGVIRVDGAAGGVDADSIWDAKGDLAVGTGPDAAVRVPVGSNGQVLVADSTVPGGLKWTTAMQVAQTYQQVKDTNATYAVAAGNYVNYNDMLYRTATGGGSGGGSGGGGVSVPVGWFIPLNAGAIGSSNIFAILVFVPYTMTFTKIGYYVTVQSGNMDLGIYDAAGTAVCREGSFAVGAAGYNKRTITAGPQTLAGGVYIVALQCNNSTAQFGAATTSGNRGEAVAYTPTNTFPLPATMPLTVGGTGMLLALWP